MSNHEKSFLLIISDLIILFCCMATVFLFRRSGSFHYNYFIQHLELFLYLFPVWLLMYYIEGLYSLGTYNPANLPISLIRGTFFSILASIIIIYLLPQNLDSITPKTNLLLIAVVAIPILYGIKSAFFKFFASESRLRGTIIIGSSETIEIVKTELSRKPHLGYKILATYTSNVSSLEITPKVQLIAIERNVTKDSNLYKKIFSLLGSDIDVIDLASFAERISGKIPIQAIDESWFIEYCGHQESRSYDVVKNIIDKIISIILLILLVPLTIIILPVLFFAHGRPVFFKQVRTGLNNKPFELYKLRTMVLDAEKSGAQWSKPGDERITKLGKILRKTRLDELPQLINIIRGEMSLVGPRPERPEIISKELSASIPYYSLRHLVKPGVTGWAQVTFRYGFSKEDSLEKLQYDLFYVKNRSIWLDLLVILKTIKTVLTGAGQ